MFNKLSEVLQSATDVVSILLILGLGGNVFYNSIA